MSFCKGKRCKALLVRIGDLSRKLFKQLDVLNRQARNNAARLLQIEAARLLQIEAARLLQFEVARRGTARSGKDEERRVGESIGASASLVKVNFGLLFRN